MNASEQAASERQRAVTQMLAASYDAQLEEQMGQLHNQFVGFIAAARLPLPQVLLVLQILVAETVAQAQEKYLGGA